jgi:predicted Zn-dependent peptidase
VRSLVAIFALSALLGSAQVPSPSAAPLVPDSSRYPTASLTDLGATKVLFENDGDSAITGVQIFVAAGLDRESAGNNGVSALVAECILRTPVDGVQLRDAIAQNGGSLSYTVDGRSVHYYIEGRSEQVGDLVALFAKAATAPDFSPATVDPARAALAARQTQFENNALSVGIQMFRRTYYATGAGQPALGNSASSAAISSAAIAAFYHATYKRQGLLASVVGLQTPGLAAALKSLASGLADGPVSAVSERAHAIPALAPRIVAHREIPAPWVVVGYAAPAPGSRDFGAMLVLESLLSDAFQRASTTSLGFVEKPIGAVYLYDSTPASLVVYVNGTQVDPSLALREVVVVTRSLSLKPLGAGALRRFKTAAEGQFISDSVNLSDRSYLLGTFASQGLGNDSINAALSALERTTASDVRRVAKNYLQRYIVALVLPRQTQSPQ